jgi:hypothetical protein
MYLACGDGICVCFASSTDLETAARLYAPQGFELVLGRTGRQSWLHLYLSCSPLLAWDTPLAEN